MKSGNLKDNFEKNKGCARILYGGKSNTLKKNCRKNYYKIVFRILLNFHNYLMYCYIFPIPSYVGYYLLPLLFFFFKNSLLYCTLGVFMGWVNPKNPSNAPKKPKKIGWLGDLMNMVLKNDKLIKNNGF